jgi:hypothetical protein
MALKAMKEKPRDIQQDRDLVTHDPLAPQEPKPEHALDPNLA